MADVTGTSFAQLLRQLRTEAGLTPEDLAEASSVSPRSISDLERGINRTARRQTAQLLADALGLAGQERAYFEAAAAGRRLPDQTPGRQDRDLPGRSFGPAASWRSATRVAFGPNVVQRLLDGDPETVIGLAREREGQWVELKQYIPQTAELARNLAGFANSGGGLLIIGVDEGGAVLGHHEADADMVRNRMRAAATGFAWLVHVRQASLDDSWLTWSLVSASSEPVVTADGRYWTRVSGQVQQAELPKPNQLTDEQAEELGLSARSEPIRVFVAMSFREEQEPALVDYWQAMLRAAKRARHDFELRRIDQLDGDYEIVERMYHEIDQAHIVIADLTLSSANVYLEIGYARGRGKYVIQLCRDDSPLEFDLRGRRTLTYRNATTLEAKLLRALDSIE